MRCKTSQHARFQWVVDLRRLVTQAGGKSSCCVSNPDWPSAIGGPARNWHCRGSSPGSPAWPASGPALRLWMPCGRRLWRSIADACDCGHRGGTFHCNTSTWGRGRNSSAGAKCTASTPLPDSAREENSPPAPPRRRTGRRRRKKNFDRSSRRRSTQAPSDVHIAQIIRLSNRRPHWDAFLNPWA